MLHIFPLMKLAPFRNDSKCDFVCECTCVCLHCREAAVIASGCTPLYVSDLGLMKLKAWQWWGASAEPHRVMGISFCCLVPVGPPTSEDPACCLHSDSVPSCTNVAEGHATYAVDAIWKVCLTATTASLAPLDWWYNWLRTDQIHVLETRSPDLFACFCLHLYQHSQANVNRWTPLLWLSGYLVMSAYCILLLYLNHSTQRERAGLYVITLYIICISLYTWKKGSQVI